MNFALWFTLSNGIKNPSITASHSILLSIRTIGGKRFFHRGIEVNGIHTAQKLRDYIVK